MGVIENLEVKRSRLHQYILDKLDDRDYHGVADAAMDLREIETAIKLHKEYHEHERTGFDPTAKASQSANSIR